MQCATPGADVVEWSMGVDLGTSFTTAAVRSGDHVEVIEIGGLRRVPSTVGRRGGALMAGPAADRLARRDPAAVERTPKRKVGGAPMVLGGTPVTAAEALAAVLGLCLTEAATRFDGTQPATLVLTHPAAWHEAQLDVLREVAQKAAPGVPLRLVPEPVAAAVHYAQDHELPPGARLAVYDLGGGTFDAAVLEVTHDGFEVVGRPGGDPGIGGEDFDQRLLEHVGAQLATSAPEWWRFVTESDDTASDIERADLLDVVRDLKHALSEHDDAAEYVRGARVEVTATRAELEALIEEPVARTVTLTDETIAGAGIDPGTLSGLFVTGGASRTPMVRERLTARFGDLVRTWADPKVVVALGAARLSGEVVAELPLQVREDLASPREVLRTEGVRVLGELLADATPGMPAAARAALARVAAEEPAEHIRTAAAELLAEPTPTHTPTHTPTPQPQPTSQPEPAGKATEREPAALPARAPATVPLDRRRVRRVGGVLTAAAATSLALAAYAGGGSDVTLALASGVPIHGLPLLAESSDGGSITPYLPGAALAILWGALAVVSPGRGWSAAVLSGAAPWLTWTALSSAWTGYYSDSVHAWYARIECDGGCGIDFGDGDWWNQLAGLVMATGALAVCWSLARRPAWTRPRAGVAALAIVVTVAALAPPVHEDAVVPLIGAALGTALFVLALAGERWQQTLAGWVATGAVYVAVFAVMDDFHMLDAHPEAGLPVTGVAAMAAVLAAALLAPWAAGRLAPAPADGSARR